MQEEDKAEPHLPYEMQWYEALTKREKEIIQEAERRKSWKKIFAAKQQRINAGTEFLNRTSPIELDGDVTKEIQEQEERLKQEYNQMIRNYYREDDEKTTFVDDFIINDNDNQPNYKVSVVINITDIRTNKTTNPRECIIKYELKKHTATKMYGLGKRYSVNNEDQPQADETSNETNNSSTHSISPQSTTFLTNVRIHKHVDNTILQKSPQSKKE